MSVSDGLGGAVVVVVVVVGVVVIVVAGVGVPEVGGVMIPEVDLFDVVVVVPAVGPSTLTWVCGAVDGDVVVDGSLEGDDVAGVVVPDAAPVGGAVLGGGDEDGASLLPEAANVGLGAGPFCPAIPSTTMARTRQAASTPNVIPSALRRDGLSIPMTFRSPCHGEVAMKVGPRGGAEGPTAGRVSSLSVLPSQ